MFGGYPPTAVGCPPTAVGYTPTAIVGRIGHSNFFSFIKAPPAQISSLSAAHIGEIQNPNALAGRVGKIGRNRVPIRGGGGGEGLQVGTNSTCYGGIQQGCAPWMSLQRRHPQAFYSARFTLHVYWRCWGTICGSMGRDTQPQPHAPPCLVSLRHSIRGRTPSIGRPISPPQGSNHITTTYSQEDCLAERVAVRLHDVARASATFLLCPC